MTPPDPERPYAKRTALSITTLGYQFIAAMILFAFIGHLIDRWRGGGQAATIGGIFLALLYMAYEVWKAVRQIK
jgi:F0F1-type ATP synthase assembly protein I